MNEETSQPESGTQEAAPNTVANKLGLLDQKSLSDLIKSNFLDEQGAAPALEEQPQEPSGEATSEEVVEDTEDSATPDEESSLTKGVQKRINKLVAAKKAAQAELEAQKAELLDLRSKLEQSERTKPKEQVDFSSAILKLDSMEKVESAYKTAVDVILWCEENPDGGFIQNENGEQTEISQREVRDLKRKAIRSKEIELPARAKFIQNQAQVESEVVKDFPWWTKPQSEEYNIAQQIIQEFPELKQKRADWKHVAGLVVEGIKSLQQRKTAKPATPVKRAPAQPSIKAPVSANPNNAQKAKKDFAANTSDKNSLSSLVKELGFI